MAASEIPFNKGLSNPRLRILDNLCVFKNLFLLIYGVVRVFLRCFKIPIRVPSIENRVHRIKENYHRIPRIKENRVPTGPYQLPNIFLKKNWARLRV